MTQLEWHDPSYLRQGTIRQREAYHVLAALGILDTLKSHDAVLAGTVPLNIDIAGSDLDIICEAHDLAAFEHKVREAFGQYNITIEHTETNGLPTLTATFTYADWPIEIFAQPRPVQQQNAFRHMIAEAHLLEVGGEQAHQTIRELKRSGFKTEPAFASYFLLGGDPYQALLDYEERLRAGKTNAGHLAHTYWIGGSPCSGKSTIAQILASEFGLMVYSCDKMYETHLSRALATKHPVMSKARYSTWDDVWMHPVDYLVDRERAFYLEESEMIAQDLLVMDEEAPVCAEGAALLPEILLPLLQDPHKAIWVVPTEQFQRGEYAKRDWIQGILSKCSNPEQAWDNWMSRDAGFASQVALQANRMSLKVITVDGSSSVQHNATQVARYFGLDT